MLSWLVTLYPWKAGHFYIVSTDSDNWQLTATLHSPNLHLWHGTGHYVEEWIIYFICSCYLLIHLYINMYLYIESLYLYSNQPK